MDFERLGMNEIELLFKRYLASPLRDWTNLSLSEGESPVPYIYTSSESSVVNLMDNDVDIIIDIEDVRYNQITFGIRAKVFSMFLRSSILFPGGTNQQEIYDFKLKSVTDDLCRFITSTGRMQIIQEAVTNRINEVGPLIWNRLMMNQ